MAITITQRPLAEVTATLSAKTPIGSVLRSAEWANVPAQLRESAFFSAGVESARVLADAQARLQKILTLSRDANGAISMDRGKFIAEMQQAATALGLRNPDPLKRGGLEDFGSERRLQLIYEQQIGQAQSKAYYLSGQDPDILDAWPAQELVRLRSAKVPRDWTSRWSDAGGRFFGGRMIALKPDPIWTKISRFGRPWPPFDFGSGMGLEEIDREEAESLGLIQPGATITPTVEQHAEELKASVKGLAPDMRTALKAVFGDQIQITDGEAVWKSGSQAAEHPEIANPPDPHQIEVTPHDSRTDRAELRNIASRSQAALEASGFIDDGEPGGAELAQTVRIHGAEIAAVASGRKALFHENLGDLAAPAAEALRPTLPAGLIAEARDGHLYVYRPDGAESTVLGDARSNLSVASAPQAFDEIHRLSQAGQDGELLGYGTARMNDPGTVIVTIEDAAGNYIAGFHALPGEAETLARQRAADYSEAFGEPMRIRILTRRPTPQ